MSKIFPVEVTYSGTLTRANARAINRVLGTAFSGSTPADVAINALQDADIAVRLVPAWALAGADKARHTREVNRSRQAQARRVERKALALA
jgi:hypothetical protein